MFIATEETPKTGLKNHGDSGAINISLPTERNAEGSYVTDYLN
jgi:hypothetical protein